jgi:hypothetical protein
MKTLEKNPTKKPINQATFSYWEIMDEACLWSSNFSKKLGYTNKDIKPTLTYFLENLIHPEDKSSFKDNFYGFIANNLHFKQNLQILNIEGKYFDFICKTNKKLPKNFSKNSKLIFFFQKKIRTPKKVKSNNFYYKETAEMTSTGSWYIDFLTRKIYWDQITRKILEYPEDYYPSLKNVHKYFDSEHLELVKKLVNECAKTGTPYDIETKMLKANDRSFWTRAIGKAVYNDKKEIIGIRGVFQDIDIIKRYQINLKKSSDIITSQNSRLFNFAHIVSHNLRSHTSNLKLISELIETTDDIEEKLELINSVKDVSASLTQTISHLNEIVTIQKIDQTKSEISFIEVLKNVIDSIGHLITNQKAIIHSDFSKAETIAYIPAYLESIMLNLVTNTIKYQHPDRDPIINLKTYTEDSKVVFEISDNGLGIDLEKYGDKLFGMYQTFHYNEDAVGIGLFITKNQVESLNGEIFVESKIGIGTTFKIKF